MSETNVTVPGRGRRVFFAPGHRAGSEKLMVKQHEQFHACGASTGLLPLENTMMRSSSLSYTFGFEQKSSLPNLHVRQPIKILKRQRMQSKVFPATGS